MADLRQTAVSPHTMQGGQAQAPRGLAATALDPLRRAYQAYQQYVGQPFQQAVRGGVRGYFGLPMMSDADALGREAYRQAEALGYTPGVGMPAGAVRLAAEGMQALPELATFIGAASRIGAAKNAPPKAPPVIFDDALLGVAVKDSKNVTGLIDNALQTDVQGVIPGKARQLDRDLAKGLYTEEDIKQSFANTLNEIRSKFGDSVTLWRADAPKKIHNADTKTIFMADEATAKKYANQGRKAKPYVVNTDDILGIYAKPSGYYEVIVRRSAID